MEKSEPNQPKECVAQRVDPILCCCYCSMACLLTIVFLCVMTCFLVYVGFLHFLRGIDAGESFQKAFIDLVGIFWSSSWC